MTRFAPFLCMFAGMLLSAGSARAEDGGDLRDLRVGMPVDEIPAGEYVDLACSTVPDHRLAGWAEYRRCPGDAAGLHAVSFHFDDRQNPLAQVNDTYEGTKVAGHPVLLTLLIDDGGIVGALRIDTDPHARLFLRKKAHLLALVVRNRYGEEGWKCSDIEPSGGEAPVGGLFIKQHCEKTADRRKFLLERALYRRAGQSIGEFVNETHLEIRRAAASP
jgi:hypothetical protein